MPLVVAGILDKRLGQGLTREVPSILVWLGGVAGVIILALILGFSGAVDTLMETGDFLVVIMRTVLFVVVRVPLSFLLGLVLALILNSKNLPGKTFSGWLSLCRGQPLPLPS